MINKILYEKPSPKEEPIYLDDISRGSRLGKVVCYTTSSKKKRIAMLTQFREKDGDCYYGFKYIDRLFKVDSHELFFESSTIEGALRNAFEGGSSGRNFYSFTSLTEFLCWAERSMRSGDFAAD